MIINLCTQCNESLIPKSALFKLVYLFETNCQCTLEVFANSDPYTSVHVAVYYHYIQIDLGSLPIQFTS